MTLDQFLESNLRNSYIEDDYIEVYVRKIERLINGKYLDFLDVANAKSR